MFILKSNSINYAADLKELIISYKTIFMNTYNVICMDISVENEADAAAAHAADDKHDDSDESKKKAKEAK
jgi:hypothetical protein